MEIGVRKPQIEADYGFYNKENKREKVFGYTQKVSEYLRSENVPNLVLIDVGARPLNVGVREYFKRKYPREKMPNIYFINPEGLNIEKQEKAYAEEHIENRFRLKQEFKDTYEYQVMMKDKKQPVLLFDNCIHTGGTIRAVKKLLEESGFSDIRVGTVIAPDPWTKVKTDFFITSKRDLENIFGGHYPFFRDENVVKTSKHVYSEIRDDASRDIRLRKEMQSVIRGYLVK